MFLEENCSKRSSTTSCSDRSLPELVLRIRVSRSDRVDSEIGVSELEESERASTIRGIRASSSSIASDRFQCGGTERSDF